MIRAAVVALAFLLTPSVARADIGVIPAVGLGSRGPTTVIVGGTLVATRGALFLGANADREICFAYCDATALSAQVGVVNHFEVGVRFLAIGELGWRWITAARDEDAGGGSASTSLPFAGVRGGMALGTGPSKDGTSFFVSLSAYLRHDLFTRELAAQNASRAGETIELGGPSLGLLLSMWVETTRKKS